MKIKLLVAVTICFISIAGFAQNKKHQNSIGLQFGTKEYAGDIGYQLYKFENLHAAFGATYSRYINRSFDATFGFSYGQMSEYKDYRNFRTNLGDFKLQAKYKLNNGYILKEDAFLHHLYL